jgi:hypothetical protein
MRGTYQFFLRPLSGGEKTLAGLKLKKKIETLKMLIIDLPYTSKVEDSFRNEIKTVQ